MLVNSGTVVNLMPYSIFKNLGTEDDELVKTNMTHNGGWGGRGGGNPMEPRGIVFMELTLGSMSLATTFFIIEVHGNYSVILGHDWIHTNRCIPSSLHQLLIQWIDNEIEVVHADASAYIVLADAMANWQHGAPSAYRRRILQATTFFASQRRDLCPCL
jgi:hypothetical protein